MELAERLSARLVALLPLRLLAGDALPISDRRPGLSGEPVLSASGAYCVADERMLLFCRYALFLLPPRRPNQRNSRLEEGCVQYEPDPGRSALAFGG